jgi:peptidoglycan/xylan/chitin deacetylase (PgdA/CDA1 family)
MKSLAERGFQTVSLREYAAALDGCAVGHRRFLITFDDAYAHLSEAVTPILSRYNFTAVVFAPWQYLGDRNTWDAAEHPELSTLKVATAVQLQDMSAGPWEVASHGKLHVDLRKVESPERRAQLIEAREGLSQLLRQPVRELAYPYGDQDRGVRDDARAAGYRMAFVAGAGRADDDFQLPRRPISGADGRLLFRLKTSAVSGPLYSLRHLSRTASRGRGWN